jgi:hypothetical protein
MGNGSFFASDFVISSASYLCNRRNKSVDPDIIASFYKGKRD